MEFKIGAADAIKPPWYDLRQWGLDEWGTFASLLGVGLWVADTFVVKKVKK